MLALTRTVDFNDNCHNTEADESHQYGSIEKDASEGFRFSSGSGVGGASTPAKSNAWHLSFLLAVVFVAGAVGGWTVATPMHIRMGNRKYLESMENENGRSTRRQEILTETQKAQDDIYIPIVYQERYIRTWLYPNNAPFRLTCSSANSRCVNSQTPNKFTFLCHSDFVCEIVLSHAMQYALVPQNSGGEGDGLVVRSGLALATTKNWKLFMSVDPTGATNNVYNGMTVELQWLPTKRFIAAWPGNFHLTDKPGSHLTYMVLEKPSNVDLPIVSNTDCATACANIRSFPLKTGIYLHNPASPFYMCAANDGGEGFRGGYNLHTSCVTGRGGRENGHSANFKCVCSNYYMFPVDSNGGTCNDICRNAGRKVPIQTGTYTHGASFGACSANQGNEGFRGGYNLYPWWSNCVVGWGGQEKKSNPFKCYCVDH